MDRQRVNAACEIVRQCSIDHAMAFDPALFFEGVRHNIDPEVGFSPGPMARMTFMLVDSPPPAGFAA